MILRDAVAAAAAAAGPDSAQPRQPDRRLRAPVPHPKTQPTTLRRGAASSRSSPSPPARWRPLPPGSRPRRPPTHVAAALLRLLLGAPIAAALVPAPLARQTPRAARPRARDGLARRLRPRRERRRRARCAPATCGAPQAARGSVHGRRGRTVPGAQANAEDASEAPWRGHTWAGTAWRP